MTEEEKGRVQELVSAGVSALQGLTLLRREFPESLATAKTFYHAKAQCRLKELAGRSPIQALMDELTSSTWTYSDKTTGDGRVTGRLNDHGIAQRILPSDVPGKESRVYRAPLGVVGGDQSMELSVAPQRSFSFPSAGRP